MKIQVKVDEEADAKKKLGITEAELVTDGICACGHHELKNPDLIGQKFELAINLTEVSTMTCSDCHAETVVLLVKGRCLTEGESASEKVKDWPVAFFGKEMELKCARNLLEKMPELEKYHRENIKESQQQLDRIVEQRGYMQQFVEGKLASSSYPAKKD